MFSAICVCVHVYNYARMCACLNVKKKYNKYVAELRNCTQGEWSGVAASQQIGAAGLGSGTIRGAWQELYVLPGGVESAPQRKIDMEKREIDRFELFWAFE